MVQYLFITFSYYFLHLSIHSHNTRIGLRNIIQKIYNLCISKKYTPLAVVARTFLSVYYVLVQLYCNESIRRGNWMLNNSAGRALSLETWKVMSSSPPSGIYSIVIFFKLITVFLKLWISHLVVIVVVMLFGRVVMYGDSDEVGPRPPRRLRGWRGGRSVPARICRRHRHLKRSSYH